MSYAIAGAYCINKLMFTMEASDKKSTAERSEALLTILRGYEKCDRDFMDKISDDSGYPIETIFSILENNPDEDDIKYLEDIISSIKEKAPILAQDTTISDLKYTIRETDLSGIKLPPVIYTELGKLVSAYSGHRKTQTVYFRDFKLDIKPDDAFQDGGKDTFEDNGVVAQNYMKLLEAIIDFSRQATTVNPYFPILAKLYQHLTTLSSEACNQQNAIDLAQVLEEYTPSLQELQDYKRLISQDHHQASSVLTSDVTADNIVSTKNDADSTAASGEAVASTEDVQQRATLPDTATDEKPEATNSNIVENKVETNAELNALLQTMFAWELMPKWFQDYIINSTPVQIILKSIAEREAIYNPKSVAEKFAEIFIIEKRDDSAEAIQDNRNEKATYTVAFSEYVDTNYIYNAVKVGILILPMVGVSVMPDELLFFGQVGIEIA